MVRQHHLSRYYYRLSQKRFVSVAPDMTVFYCGIRSWECILLMVVFFLSHAVIGSFVDTRSSIYWVPLVTSLGLSGFLHVALYLRNLASYPVVTPKDV